MPLTAKLRRLFQALSVLSAIAGVLLCVLWVRSYWWFDQLEGRLASRNISILSAQGQLRFGAVANVQHLSWDWTTHRIRDEKYGLILWIPGGKTWLLSKVFSFSSSATHTVVWVPAWVPTLIFAASAAVPRFRRFSLRTLLIATTVVAVALGMIAYALEIK